MMNLSLNSNPEAGASDGVQDLIILGAGPAGLSAAIYGARANHAPLLITGHELGGQVAQTTLVENYPGFEEGVLGPDLARAMQNQAERFGARVAYDTIAEVDLRVRPFRLRGEDGEYLTRSLIIATGATPRKLGVRGEEELVGRGVSYCATCDGYFFKGKEIVVVGGGDSALEESLFLTKFASRVTLLHRRDAFRAGAILQKRARENDKIRFLRSTIVTEILGATRVEGVRIKDICNGKEMVLPADGAFIFIGHRPNTDLFAGQLELDPQGYIVSDRQMHTSVEGVWAAGEATDSRFRQVVTSAGMGAAAAIEAEKYLAEHEPDRVMA